uniref:Uncharacterized protein n=1 Tax=Arundo donax TaxID=35708 RepID=A0A0A9BT00_ARUDO
MISSLENQLHVEDGFLELRDAILHSVAEIKHDKRSLELLLHCFPLLCNLAAG